MSTKEISTLMYISGDVKTPNLQSVQLMAKILRDQMNILLQKAEKSAFIRESIYLNRMISHGDILFIIRNNKTKLKRLLKHLNDMDVKSGLNASRDHLYTMEPNPKQRYLKMSIDFLATIEDCGEFSSVLHDKSIMDISMKKREMRQHWRINRMTPSEQEEYLKISKEISRPIPEFKEWLMKDEVTNLDVTDCALSIIEFLARETIAEIVDMILMVKMKRLGKGQYLLHDYCADLVQVGSEWKADTVEIPIEVTDEPQLGSLSAIWNETSDEVHLDSVPVHIDESSRDTSSQGTRHATNGLSDALANSNAPDTTLFHYKDIEISEMSDSDLLDSLQDNYHPNNHDSQEPRLNDLSDISDASDLDVRQEMQDTECKTNTCKIKPSRRRSRSSCHFKTYICHVPEEPMTFDTSAASNHLSISAKNEVEFLSPIEPREIVDAFVRLQEPSPQAMMFNIHPGMMIRREKKLICLADSLSVDVL